MILKLKAKTESDYLSKLFSFNIKYYRYLNNYSQEKLAELCDLSPRYISDIERGRKWFAFSNVVKIAKVFNIEYYELFINTERDVKVIERMKHSRQYNQKP